MNKNKALIILSKISYIDKKKRNASIDYKSWYLHKKNVLANKTQIYINVNQSEIKIEFFLNFHLYLYNLPYILEMD